MPNLEIIQLNIIGNFSLKQKPLFKKLEKTLPIVNEAFEFHLFTGEVLEQNKKEFKYAYLGEKRIQICSSRCRTNLD